MADRDLTPEDYEKFLEKIGADPICPICKNDDWGVVSEQDGRSYCLPNYQRNNPVSTDLRAALILLIACRNCGFIAPILREKIISALEAGNG